MPIDNLRSGHDQGFVRWWVDEMYDSQGEEATDQPYWPYLYNATPSEIERSKLIPQEQVRATAREFLADGGKRPRRGYPGGPGYGL